MKLRSHFSFIQVSIKYPENRTWNQIFHGNKANKVSGGTLARPGGTHLEEEEEDDDDDFFLICLLTVLVWHILFAYILLVDIYSRYSL